MTESRSFAPTLERAPGTEPAFLLATISTGSLVSLINGEAESPLP